jgi:hypothetical protein
LEDFGVDLNKPYSKLTKAQQTKALSSLFSMLKKDAMKKMKRDNPSLYKIYKEQGVTEVDNNMTQEIIDTLRSNI